MDTQERTVRVLVSKHAQTLARRLAHAVRPILAETSRGPELVGTAVLLRVGEVGFLLSAAHVLDKRHRPLFVAAAGGVVAVEGEFLTSALPASGRRDDDQTDVGIVRLPASAARSIADSDWVAIDKTDVDEQPCFEPALATNYLLLGYFASKMRTDRASKRASVPMFILTTVAAPSETSKKIGVDDESHLVLEFDQRRMHTPCGQQTAPDPQGISGGAIWALNRGFDANDRNPRLVAITIERHWANKAIVGTRLAMFFEVIRSRYEKLGGLLPRSTVRQISASRQ